jgi:hypothetical protein
VSAAVRTIDPVPDLDPAYALHHLATGDPVALAEFLDRARTSDDATTLVVAALFASDGAGLLARAQRHAVTTRERQTVAIAAAHLRGDRERVDALAREHLIEHPDSVLVAWIAGAGARRAASGPTDPSDPSDPIDPTMPKERP